uniref:Uncharacterized protein n=1 Tax=Mus musculus TaxID=10090 RepID=Q8C4L7_MOUSE|nr:unnamed protein product [Mus musculus]
MYGPADFFFFLIEVNSCLTILPSDVFLVGSWRERTARGMQSEDCVAVGVAPTFTPISLEVGSTVTQQSSAVTCCFNISWNVLEGNVSFACARLCSFLLLI